VSVSAKVGTTKKHKCGKLCKKYRYVKTIKYAFVFVRRRRKGKEWKITFR